MAWLDDACPGKLNDSLSFALRESAPATTSSSLFHHVMDNDREGQAAYDDSEHVIAIEHGIMRMAL